MTDEANHEPLNPNDVLAEWHAREPLPPDELKLAKAIADRLWTPDSRLGDVIVAMLHEGEDPNPACAVCGDGGEPEESVDEKEAAKIASMDPRSFGDIVRRGAGPGFFLVPNSRFRRYLPSEIRRWLHSSYVPGAGSAALRNRVRKLRAKALGVEPQLEETPHMRMVAHQREVEARERRNREAAPPPSPELVRATKIIEALRVGAAKSETEKAELLAAALREGDAQ